MGCGEAQLSKGHLIVLAGHVVHGPVRQQGNPVYNQVQSKVKIFVSDGKETDDVNSGKTVY